MTPEEKFNQDVWWVLQEIAEEKLATTEGKPVEFEIVKLIAAGIPSQDRQISIFHKLEEWGAIKIIEEMPADWRGSGEIGLQQPKFDEVYDKYKKARDLTSYLNNYQERMLKGDSLPEFFQIEHIDNKEKATPATPIKHKGQMLETGSGGGYYNRSHPIRPMKKQSANKIVDGFSSSNYAFVLMVSEGILSASEFGSDGEVNYRLQSAPGQMLMQERQLLSKFEKLGLFRNLGEDGIFAIAELRDVDTKTIGQIVTEIKSRQLNPQTKPEGKSADLKVRYNQLLEEIRKPKQTSSDLSNLEERYQKTINEIKGREKNPFITNQTDTQAETDLTDTASRKGYEKKWDVLQAIWEVYESHSRPDSILVPVARLTIKGRDVQLIDGIVEGFKKEGLYQKWGRQDRWYNLEFINHEMLPKAYQEVGNTYKKFAVAYEQKKGGTLKQDGSGATKTQEQTKPTLPSGWELVEKDNTLQIIKGGSVVFTFPNNWSNKYRYFSCLWDNYGTRINYKEVYEYKSELKYPEKSVWRINRNMRTTINKLRKEFKNKNLHIHIETNKGFTLTIS